jgi:hypothetical protein
MLPITTERLRNELAAIRTIVEFYEHVGLHFQNEDPLDEAAKAGNAKEYLRARQSLPQKLARVIFNHCAFVTRLYAVYEQFVLDLAAEWVRLLPRFYGDYASLDEKVRNEYRVGIGNLLQKYGGPRTDHLSELNLVTGLYEGLNSSPGYSLLPDAFFFDLNNLKENELSRLFERIGLDGVKSWLANFPPLVAHCETAEASVQSRLKTLVEYRNDAAHSGADVDDLLGLTECASYLEFIERLCEGLFQFVLAACVRRAIPISKCQCLGTVTEFFKKAGASVIKMEPAILILKDAVIALGPTACVSITIESL